MNRRIIGTIVAVALAVLGTVALIGFVQRAEDRALEGEETVKVWVVTERVPAGTDGESLTGYAEEKRVPSKVRAAGAVSDLERLEDYVASTDLLPGEQVVLDRFVEPRSFDSTPNQIGVPQGQIEITLALSPERALGGRVRAGDRVTLFSSFEPFDLEGNVTVDVNGEIVPLPQQGTDIDAKTPNSTHMIDHQILVTEVQTEQSGADDSAVQSASASGVNQPSEAATGEVYVTIAIDPDTAERVVFTAEFGRVWLGNEPEPTDTSDTKLVDRGNVYDNTGSENDTGAPVEPIQ